MTVQDETKSGSAERFLLEAEQAILGSDWAGLETAAHGWLSRVTSGSDPRPHFALNVVQLIKADFGAAWQTHAKCLQEAADIEAVRTWVEGLLQQHQDRASVHLVVGLFLAQSGKSEQSIARYKDAIRLDPTSPYAHYFLAQIYERSERMEMAVKAYREAVKLDPVYAAARTNLGVAYQHQGQLELAIPQYREVIKLNPNDAIAHANLACALAEQGKIEAAVAEYKEAIRLNPRDAELHFAL